MDNMDSISRPLQGPIRTEATPAFDVTAEEAIQAGVAPIVAPRIIAKPRPAPAPSITVDQPDVKALATMYSNALETKGRAELRIEAARTALEAATAEARRAAAQAEELRLELVKMLAAPCSS